ncbi:NAD-dependent epimerase/dehydratase family protein [Puniceicoccus vermicola]|uniref:NAD-dependent epimerase/dehydratase family protein n=1 Tax=Puniceicoccus vermicola TaxID=388746 RepID=A0A7X1E4B1_9BACT|nr:NAD-dependent epimerase/dehydratase family protein [Puniceicoccus vermicola]
MRILITGGAGFIGSHVVEHYQGKADIRVLDNLRTGYRENLDGLDCELVEASILDREALAEAMQDVDYVFHLAALISVPESMENPQGCVDLNVTGLLNVLETAQRFGVKKVVLASSAAVYGDNPTVPKIETMTPEPRSPYAITKLDGEYYCDLYRREGWVNTACLRFFNVFGPRQDPHSAYAAAVPIFIDRARKNEPITIFGDGEQTRDFIYVKDIAAGLAFAAETEAVAGANNIGYGGSITINQLAEKIISLTGSQSKILHAPTRSGDVKHSRASAEKLAATGWQPLYGFEEGLAQTLR